MAERSTNAPEIKLPTLGGLNERPSKANLRTGEFDILEGMYPKDIGLQARIPGQQLLATAGTGPVRQIHSTTNVNGDVLVQSGSVLYAYTLDELQNRVVPPELVFNPSGDEEVMSQAIIVQMEASTVNGGSADGKQTGTSSATANTFTYGRRLTDMLVNESSTVSSFTASTGGGGSTSTAGQFTLAPGDYRISVIATYNSAFTSQTIVAGLFNVTSNAFEVYSGTSVPILSTPMVTSSFSGNTVLSIKAAISVTSTNKTYQINHQSNVSSAVQSATFCGAPLTASGTAGGAAPKNTYCWIEILKLA